MSKLLKTLIVVLVALFTNINFSSAQQWSVTGNNISNSNTGNVGIGLTAPLMKMDIKGLYGLPATGGTQNGSLRLSHTSGTMVMDMGLGNSSGWIQTTNSGSLISTYPLLINPNGGNVGIGTSTTPIATLDVNGTMHVNGDINAYNVLTFQDKSYRFDVPSTIIPNLRTTPFSMPIYGIASPLVTGSADLWLSGYNAIRMFTASNPIPRLSILYNGYVGIGTLTPSQLLDIETNADYQFRVGNTTGCGYNIGRTVTTGYLTFYGDQSGAIGYNFGGVNGTLMTINGNGNVSIGTTLPDPTNAMLTVNGTIHAKEVDVDVNIPADYVFKSDYNLMSLNDVEKYVKTNSHLPDIPSAEEITKNGFKMGEMQNKLLQKVEELTLYVIEQQKKIDELEKKLK